jgi:hypothetical protein
LGEKESTRTLMLQGQHMFIAAKGEAQEEVGRNENKKTIQKRDANQKSFQRDFRCQESHENKSALPVQRLPKTHDTQRNEKAPENEAWNNGQLLR